MKTKLTLACLLFSSMLMAQVTDLSTVLNLSQRAIEEKDKAYGIVPSALSFDGTNRVYIRVEDDLVGIYSNSFSPVRQFSITPTQHIYISESKEILSTYASFSFSGDKNPSFQDIPSTWTDEDVKNFLDTVTAYPYDGNITILSYRAHPEGGTMYIPDMDESNYYEYELFGKKYPTYYWLRRDNILYECYNVYYYTSYIYADNWIEVEVESFVLNSGISFVNYDNDISDCTSDGLCLTQTLFNNDANYEYLQFPMSSFTIYESTGPTCPSCPEIRGKGSTYTSFNVMSEDGSILQSVSFPDGFKMIEYVRVEIIKLSNEFYMLCTGKMNDTPAMLVYKINRTGSGASVQQVAEPQQISGAYKFIHRGNVYIKHGNRTFTLQGQDVR